MSTSKPKHILVAPLDWGLGHTTRCIPLIGYMLSQGHIVTVAGNHSQRKFIEETFSCIDFIHLDGYNITYSKWNKYAQAGLLAQLPDILKTIKRENNWLLDLTNQRKIDGIISDNRYGLYHPSIPSVIMTHQLMVQSGLSKFIDRNIQKIHFNLFTRFGKTWILDVPGIPNLGNSLSHSKALPRNAEYIGLLSRFSDLVSRSSPFINDKSADVLIMLSGPEPQRTEISQLLWQQACRYPGKIAFIEGSENAMMPANIPAHITYHKRLTSKQLFQILERAGIIICRSGYSSLMDLAVMHKKAILIPTPGQTEQIYLAKHLHKEGIYYAATQQGFDLVSALKNADSFPYKMPLPEASFNLFKGIVKNWVDSL